MGKRHIFFANDLYPTPIIYSVGFCDDKRTARFGPSRRNSFFVHYVLSGKGVFNGKEVVAGHGFLITPMMHEHYYPNEDEPWSYLWVESSDFAMTRYFEAHSADSNGIFSFANLPFVWGIANRLCSARDELKCTSSYLTEMFLTVFNNCICPGGSVGIRSGDLYLDYATRFIKSSLANVPTVAELCNRLGISQPYLYKLFMSKCMISPKKYITECKLSEACRLLLETDLSVSDIALSVGYGDPLAFSRMFSSHRGCSPTEYRRRGIDM